MNHEIDPLEALAASGLHPIVIDENTDFDALTEQLGLRPAKKHKTNVEFVTDLMTYSRYGALIQAFVMTAIQRYAEKAAKEPIPDNGVISPAAWQGCAVEVLTKLEEHYRE